MKVMNKHRVQPAKDFVQQLNVGDSIGTPLVLRLVRGWIGECTKDSNWASNLNIMWQISRSAQMKSSFHDTTMVNGGSKAWTHLVTKNCWSAYVGFRGETIGWYRQFGETWRLCNYPISNGARAIFLLGLGTDLYSQRLKTPSGGDKNQTCLPSAWETANEQIASFFWAGTAFF